jgi:OmcA/MtrC family decaheme c-type cytochrome
VIQVSGNARGTGSNTADGSNSGVPGVPIGKPLNLVFDWWPATAKVATATDAGQREVVNVSGCLDCHSKFQFHGGNRQETKFCVVCHTDQRRYGRTEATIAGNVFSGSTNIVDGRTVGWFPNYIHKIHAGHHLAKTGYNYAGVEFNHITYPQDVKNCVKCHNGADGAANKTAQGDNWKTVPSRLACGACHDGINFATGKGLTLADARAGLTTSAFGHVGGAHADDSKCAICHSAADIPVYHMTIDPTGSSGRAGYPVNTATDVPTPGYPKGQGPSIPLASQLGNLPAGVYKINF